MERALLRLQEEQAASVRTWGLLCREVTLKAEPGVSEERSVHTSLHPLRQHYNFPAVSCGVFPYEVNGGAAIIASPCVL